MPTTCPHCGTTSPAKSDACNGCGRGLYRLSDPSTIPALWLSFRPARMWMWVAVGALIVLVTAGASTSLFFDDNDDGNNQAGEERTSQDRVPGPSISLDPTPSGSPSSKPPEEKPLSEPSPSEKETPSSAPPKSTPSAKPTPGIPGGFHRVLDDLGFSVGVMEGWQRRPLSATHVDYVPPTGQEVLRIGVVPGAPGDSFANFQEAERQLSSNDPSYQRVRLEQNTFAGRPGALWEFTWTNAGTGEVMKARDQAYIAPDGTEYTIYFEGRERLWAEKVFSTALSTWEVRGG